MRHHPIYREARELRRAELTRLWNLAVCRLRRGFARLARRPAPARAPCREQHA